MKIKRTSTWNVVARWPTDIEGYNEVLTARRALVNSTPDIVEASSENDLENRRITHTIIFASEVALTALKGHLSWQQGLDYNLSVGMTRHWLKEEGYNELTGEWVLIREGTEQF